MKTSETIWLRKYSQKDRYKRSKKWYRKVVRTGRPQYIGYYHYINAMAGNESKHPGLERRLIQDFENTMKQTMKPKPKMLYGSITQTLTPSQKAEMEAWNRLLMPSKHSAISDDTVDCVTFPSVNIYSY